MLAELAIEPATSRSQVLDATDWAIDLSMLSTCKCDKKL